MYFHDLTLYTNYIVVQERSEQIIKISIGNVIIPYTKVGNLEIPVCVTKVNNFEALLFI